MNEAHRHASWGYGTEDGPSTWTHSFSDCAGKEQSPIDINDLAATEAAQRTSNPLVIQFRPAARGTLSIVNNGHAVQVQGDGLTGDATRLDGVSYALQQFHFHRHSETTIDGEHLPLEAQFVHKAADGSIMVVAVLFEKGSSNPTLAKLAWKGLSPSAGKRPLPEFNPAMVLPDVRDFFFYRGSFTTPPCTEGVKWVVLREYQAVTAVQLAAFPFERNFRPVQPLNGRARFVEISEHADGDRRGDGADPKVPEKCVLSMTVRVVTRAIRCRPSTFAVGMLRKYGRRGRAPAGTCC